MSSLVLTFVMPIGLQNIGWKMYMVNASWDIVVLGLIVSDTELPRSESPPLDGGLFYTLILTVSQAYYWVETKGRTLEEIDAIFEGQKHSTVPDVETVRRGEKTITLEAIEKDTSA